MGEIVVIVAVFVLGLAWIYHCGEACCWPDRDPFRRIRYWFGGPEYVHSEDVPWGYDFSGDRSKYSRRLFAAHRRAPVSRW